MKKRSLVAALAMLLVSALVLTSATYAWFAKSNSAQVQAVTTQAGNAGGALEVSVDQTNWKTTLTSKDLGQTYEQSGGVDDLTKPIAATLTPVDMLPGSGTSITWFGCNYTGQDFTASANGSGYLHKTFYLRTDSVDKYIELNPSFTPSQFIWGMVIVDGQRVIWGDGSYTPFSSGTLQATEVGTNDGVVSVGEVTTGALATDNGNPLLVSQSNSTSITLTPAANKKTFQIDYYIWAEGQDQDCYGTVDLTNTGFTFAPAYGSTIA